MFKFFKSTQKSSGQPFQLGNLIEILQDGICITNIGGEVIYLNKAAYALLGIEKGIDISKFNFFDTFIRDENKIKILKQQINQLGLVKNYELVLHKVSGGTLDAILTMNFVGDFRQQTIGFLFLFKDITELKKIQQQLLQTQKLESIGLMASGIAHDFNNILAAIIPNAELIKYSTSKTDENYARAEIIEKSAHRASDIAQRLLTFTRQNDHQMLQQVNLNQVIGDSLELLEHSIPESVRILKQLDPKLKHMKGDEAQLQQIVMNLVINAVDAMPNGGTVILRTENFRIENYYQVGALEPGDYIRLSIKDTGTGIPMEIIPKIFDPFFTTKEIGKGTGLGLSVVYGIVKGMSGHIEVKSKLNEGTQFDLYFPCEALASRVEEPEKVTDFETGNLKILIIDDEDYVLNILGDILEFLGHQVVKFNNGREALEYFRENHSEFEYVIVDLKMPNIDGRMTSSEMRKIKPDIKIIFTSGFDDSPLTDEDMSGVVGFLKKPYSINQVSKSLREIFAK